MTLKNDRFVTNKMIKTGKFGQMMGISFTLFSRMNFFQWIPNHFSIKIDQILNPWNIDLYRMHTKINYCIFESCNHWYFSNYYDYDCFKNQLSIPIFMTGVNLMKRLITCALHLFGIHNYSLNSSLRVRLVSILKLSIPDPNAMINNHL